jgi:hypothetical protein
MPDAGVDPPALTVIAPAVNPIRTTTATVTIRALLRRISLAGM